MNELRLRETTGVPKVLLESKKPTQWPIPSLHGYGWAICLTAECEQPHRTTAGALPPPAWGRTLCKKQASSNTGILDVPAGLTLELLEFSACSLFPLLVASLVRLLDTTLLPAPPPPAPPPYQEFL